MRSGLFTISRGELAKLGDGGGDNVQSEIDIGFRGVAAKAEAEAGAGFFRRQTNGSKHVRWLDGARGTGSSGRTRETL